MTLLSASLVALTTGSLLACATPLPDPDTGPGHSPMSTASEMEAQAWVATEIDGAPVAEGVESTMRFGSDGVVSGSTGCNRYRASYEVTDDVLRVGPAAVTKRACPPLMMEQEDRFLALLSDPQRVEASSEALVLSPAAGDGSPSRFVPVPPSESE